MKVGDPVILCTPGNPILDGIRGTVKALAPYGYLVATPVGSGEFRAFPEEVELFRAPESPDSRRASGFAEDTCPVCKGQRMVRSGTCLTCTECGSTSGCG